jgi:hypothetical protein
MGACFLAVRESRAQGARKSARPTELLIANQHVEIWGEQVWPVTS